METVVDLIDQVLNNHDDEAKLEVISKQVHALMSHRPLFV
jgi:glycine hydroxymethyltransferase